MAIQTDEAFVLRRSPLRETSILATLFARKAGKIKVVVKGVRKEKATGIGALEPFSRVSVVYYEKLKSDIHLASAVGIIDSQVSLRSRLDRMSYASYLTELVDTVFAPHDTHEDVFDLLATSYELLNRSLPSTVARVFEVKLLERIGWLPVLTRCVLCGSEDLGQVFFSPRQGGIMCRSCDRGEAGTLRISNGTRQSLLFFTHSSVERAVTLRLGRAIERELEHLGERFFRYHLDFSLRSQRFIAQIQPALQPQ